ncbi:glycosyltransferase family 4 protein [Prevotella sp. P3-122]|uniref:glycosyltransferase family 4 protein n=1 Tax=Prevotella sp. P3-122 TaxID=2024223 RepID=UPI00113FE0FC|nr:glycosyltransferase family 4 protein [Prevotella sp. P3-122]
MNVRMMNIAFIIESDYNSGGMERMLSTMANRLTEWFDITTITAFNEGRALCDYTFAMGKLDKQKGRVANFL